MPSIVQDIPFWSLDLQPRYSSWKLLTVTSSLEMLETTCHVSHSLVRCPMSLFNLSQTVRARALQFSPNNHYTLWVQCHMSGVTYQVSHVRCHISLVMCHVSCVMWYVSYVIYIFFTKLLSWLVEALLSTVFSLGFFGHFFMVKSNIKDLKN